MRPRPPRSSWLMGERQPIPNRVPTARTRLDTPASPCLALRPCRTASDPLQPPIARPNRHPEPCPPPPPIICSNPLTLFASASRLSAAVAAIPDDQPAAAALRRQAARLVYQANEHEATTDDLERADDRIDHRLHALISAIALDEETASETRKATDRARSRAAAVEEVARNICAQAAALSR